MFKHSITKETESDADVEERIIKFGLTHEFGDLTWNPSQNSVVYKKDFRVPIETQGDGVNDYIGLEPVDPIAIEANRALGNDNHIGFE